MRIAILALLAACGESTVKISPVFDLPATDDDANPSGLDTLVLSVAHAGDEQDLASRSFKPGEQIELATVPFDDALVVHLSGQLGGTPAAYGRTCAFSVTADGDTPRPHLWFARSVRFASLGFTPGAHAGGIAIEDSGGALLAGGDETTIERFDPMTGALATLGQLVPRRGAVAARIGPAGVAQRIAIVGGDTQGGYLDLVDPGERAARVERIEDLRLARSALTATTLTDGRVVVIGGRNAGVASGDLVEVSANSTGPEIRIVRTKLAHPRAEHTATRLGDDVGAPVLIIGGTDDTNVVAVAELWKPLSGDLAPPTFAPTMLTPRRGHHAELMPDGSVLVIGGIDATGAPVTKLERFVIDAGFVDAGELPPGAGVVDATTTRLPDGRILITGGRPTVGGDPVDVALIARLDVVNGSVDVVQTDRLASARAGHVAALLCDGTVWISGGTDVAPLAERYNPPPAGRR